MMNRAITLTLITITLGLAPLAIASDADSKAAVCSGCHGPAGHSAVPDNPILAAQHEAYLMSSLQLYVSGERNHEIMKTMAGRLSTQDLTEIAAYFAAQSPYQSQVVAAGDATRGKDKTAACAGCHGPDGRSATPMFPKLAGQHAQYLSNALQAYKDGTRTNAMMSASLVEPLSDQDIDDIAAYYASQAPVPPASNPATEEKQ